MSCPENQLKKLTPPHPGVGGEVLGVKKLKSPGNFMNCRESNYPERLHKYSGRSQLIRGWEEGEADWREAWMEAEKEAGRGGREGGRKGGADGWGPSEAGLTS